MRYVTIFMILFISNLCVSFACDCEVPKSALKALKQVNFVFQGEIIKHESSGSLIGGETVAFVNVDRVWKGLNESEILVYTDWSTCGFKFEDGKSYLFYAYERSGKPFITNCSKTKLLEQADDDLKELGQGRFPLNIVDLEVEYFWVKNEGVIFKTVVFLVISLLVIYMIRVRFYRRT